MVQRSEDLRFTLKPGQPFRMVRDRRRQNFDSDVTPQLGVCRAIHFAHATLAEGRKDFVRA
jgi:hypothetical protein